MINRYLIDELQEEFTGHIDLSEENPEIFAKFVQFMYTGNYDDEDHLNPVGCDDAVLQPIDEILFSLGHGTDLPGISHYDMDIWEDSIDGYWLEDSGGIRTCRSCATCLCVDCDSDRSGLCEYRSTKQQRYRCAEMEYSSDEGDYCEDGETDGDDVPLANLETQVSVAWSSTPATNELAYPDDDGYVTDLPHAMFTAVRVYAMADMFCVPALKVLARNRFYRAAEKNTESLDFPDVLNEVFETTAPGDWALKEVCVLFIRASCFGSPRGRDETLMAAIQPVLCKHADLVEKILLLPEAEGHYFDEGRLCKYDLENKLEDMNFG